MDRNTEKELLKAADMQGLSAEMHEVLSEAKRYRWLREAQHDWYDAGIVSVFWGYDISQKSGEELDAIIDREMDSKSYTL